MPAAANATVAMMLQYLRFIRALLFLVACSGTDPIIRHLPNGSKLCRLRRGILDLVTKPNIRSYEEMLGGDP